MLLLGSCFGLPFLAFLLLLVLGPKTCGCFLPHANTCTSFGTCVQMSYAELLWVDHLGMYVRLETEGHPDGPMVARVPFYRPVLDERDARSVITMAAQIAWEEERPYTPPVPSIFTDAAAAANN